MTIWYVRPDAGHSGTRNGKAYSTAWGGWSEIVWGGMGIIAGDTLYVCGTHSVPTVIGIGPHGGTANSRVTISGAYASDPGTIIISATGNIYLNINRSYTTLTNLTIRAKSLSAVVLTGIPLTGVTVRNCRFYGSAAAMLVMYAGNNFTYSDIWIDSNTFIDGSGGPGGAAIQWLAAGTVMSTLSRCTITNNTFTGCSATRAVILLRAEDTVNASTKMEDIVVFGNTMTNCYAVAMEIYGPSVYGRNTGVRVFNNIIRNQQLLGTFGGGIVLGGFGPSLTESFGSNEIAWNKAYRLAGPSGFLNIFYGSYIAHENYAEDLSTGTIDGNGILFDHGCNNCVAYSNEIKRLIGKEGVPYSGIGIMVLDATNCRAWGNIIDGCKSGFYVGNKLGGQSSDIFNNTFLNCSEAGADITITADKITNSVRNNLFTTANPSLPPVRVVSGPWTGESHNAFHGFGPASGHTLHSSDVIADPLMDLNYRPQSSSLQGCGLYLGGKDFYGKQFYNPPNIGAVDAVSVSPGYLFTAA